MNMKNIIYLLSFIIVSFLGCSGTTVKNSDKEIDTQDREAILRFDKDIYDYLMKPDSAKQTALRQKYPILLLAYGSIAMDNNNPQTYFSTLREYFSNSSLKQVYKDELNIFSDLSSYETDIAGINSRVMKEFPGKSLPQLSMHVSGFRENVIVLRDLISVSADKYLGSDYAGYRDYFQPYERQQMQPAYLVRDYVKAWLLSDNLIKETTGIPNLLTEMVEAGKVLYALSVLMPDRSVDDIIGYTSVETGWCKANEKKIWQTIVKQNHLFSTDNMVLTRYINDAPNTVPLGAESPGRVGCWVGWQLMNHYVKKTGASLEQLLEADAQTILRNSKYNP